MTDYDEREKGRIARLRDNSLQSNYQPHDIASGVLIQRCEELGYTVEEHGDDKRDSEEVYSGTGVDYRVLSPDDGRTCGYFEVKSKRSEEWIGRLNRTHMEEYAGFAAYVEQPVVLAFALVDESEQCVEKWAFTHIPVWGTGDIYEELPFESKGHAVVEIKNEYLRSWPFVMSRFFPP